ncbi:MAG: transcriptional repressor LexA [Anaerolineae bacterium]|nr:transcriptional repressor LexA [Anaerolineae bacterium]
MTKRKSALSDRHKKILEVLEHHQTDVGYPPSIREIGKAAGISSTSVVNYYLNQLEEMNYIERDRKISRGVRLIKSASGQIKDFTESVKQVVDDLIQIPLVGAIGASLPVPTPSSDFNYYDPESSVDVARSLLPERDRGDDLYALEVDGDSMIDAMVNDGDIVIMKYTQEVRNGEMVAVRLVDKDETTLKFFFKENGGVRLQPANPTMEPIIVDDPASVLIQGKVVLVIRQVPGSPI